MKYVKTHTLSQIFQNLNPQDLQFLESHCSRLRLKRGQPLFLAGDKPHALYAIVSGCLKNVRETHTGHSFITRLLGPGRIVGLRELFASVIYKRTCIALQNSEVFAINHETIKTLINKNASLGFHFIKICADELIYMENMLEFHLHRPAKNRLAVILYQLYQMLAKEGSNSFVSPLQRTDIAELAGMTPETVSRSLREFKKSKILKTTGKHFVVLDPIALKNYVE